MKLLLAIAALVLGASARADSCGISFDLLASGQSAVNAAAAGAEMAQKICARLPKETIPDAATQQMCANIGNPAANPSLQAADVQKALNDFERKFGIPKAEFLEAVARKNLPALMAQAPNHPISSDLLSAALEKSDAAASPAPQAPPSVTGTDARTNRGLSSKVEKSLRDRLRDRFREASAHSPSSGGDDELSGLTPSPDENLFSSAEDSAGLTLFEVIHLRYEKLTPRMRPRN